LDVFIETSQ